MSVMLAGVSAQSKARPDASLRRALYVAAFILLWMVAISVRLVYLQVSRHDNLVERARLQQQEAIETSPQRGQLLDRQGRELARSVDTDSIFVAPEEFKRNTDAETKAEIECTAEGLASVLRLDKKTLIKELSEALASGRRFEWIARRLSPELAEKIRSLNLAALHWRKEPKRYYPNGSLAAHVLGFVGLDGAGLGGVERFYNEKIAGEPGKLFLEKDSGRNAYESFEIPSQPGQTVVLTLDQAIQYRVEQSLAAAIQQTHAKSAAAIVLDPHTGEILALANSPTFDPNNPGAASPQARSNWALQNMYEPGSTFKVVAYSAAIQEGLIKPDDKIDCQMGKITIAGRLIHDHHPYGTLTASEALAKSSNIAAIKLGLRLGNSRMYEYITRFGFGSRTGVELPGETAGSVRPVRQWQASSIGSIAMGQEVGVTPLQMVAAFGALANKGVRVSPHLVREIRSSSGAVVYRPRIEERQVISEIAATQLKGMLEGVTLSGTAKKAQLNGYTAAGKTGTAQKIDPRTKTYSTTKYVGSFVGFAPVDNPSVVIIVVVDEPAGAYHGGDVAAPVFRDIAEQVLPELGTLPDTEIKLPPGQVAQVRQTPEVNEKQREEDTKQEEARAASMPTVSAGDGNGQEIIYANATSKAILMPDMYGRSVRDVARTCALLGLQLEAHGDGRVTRQSPAPGTEVDAGQVVQIQFGKGH